MKVKPTKINLIHLKQKRKNLLEIKDLLEKREKFLRKELDRVKLEYDQIKLSFENQKNLAYPSLTDSIKRVGYFPLYLESVGSEGFWDVSVSYIDKGGISLPTYTIEENTSKLSERRYDLILTSIRDDIAYRNFQKMIPQLIKIAEKEQQIVILEAALGYTKMILNSLTKSRLPAIDDNIKEITSILEESEKDDFVRLKKFKAGLSK